MNKSNFLFPLAVFAVLMTTANYASAGAMYKCTGQDGKSVFQQMPCSIDSLGSLEDTKAAVASQQQAAVLHAAGADYTQRIQELQSLMEKDEQLNEAFEQKK